MSTQPLRVLKTAPPNTWHMYRAMVGLGMLCGLLIVVVFQTTKPRIERNQAAALERAILQVLPAAKTSAAFRLTDDQRFERLSGPTDGRVVYAGYDEQGGLVGLAIAAQGMGYADVIRVLYGYSFADDAIIGLRVLESKETPGLGDKIERDPGFQQNFAKLDVSLTADAAAVAHPIEFAKHGTKTSAWQVDGITGATISSTAIANMLRDSTADWIPRVKRRMADFKKAD